MSTTVTLGDIPFVIPDQGANPKDSFWGQNVTDWIVEASSRINAFTTLVSQTSQTINDNSTNIPLTFLSFDPTEYRRVEIEFSIKRNTAFESGKLLMTTNGVTWDFTLEYDGAPPTDVVLSIVGSNVVYTSGVGPTPGTSNIIYKATGLTT